MQKGVAYIYIFFSELMSTRARIRDFSSNIVTRCYILVPFILFISFVPIVTNFIGLPSSQIFIFLWTLSLSSYNLSEGVRNNNRDSFFLVLFFRWIQVKCVIFYFFFYAFAFYFYSAYDSNFRLALENRSLLSAFLFICERMETYEGYKSNY